MYWGIGLLYGPKIGKPSSIRREIFTGRRPPGFCNKVTNIGSNYAQEKELKNYSWAPHVSTFETNEF
jgi:hypothetical protein